MSAFWGYVDQAQWIDWGLCAVAAICLIRDLRRRA